MNDAKSMAPVSQRVRLVEWSLGLIARVVLPLVGLVLIELVFRFGAWEPFAERESFAGMAIQSRNEVAAYHGRIDFVTLGNSHAEFGLDHGLVSEQARRLGFVHADLSLRGAHWLTLGEQSRWLRKHRPDIRNAVIALSVGDFLWPDNGDYELSLSVPWRSFGLPSEEWRSRFSWAETASIAVWSSFFAYRKDLRDFLSQPGRRLGVLATRPARPQFARMFESRNYPFDICSVPQGTIEECAAFSGATMIERNAVKQCREAMTVHRDDWSNPANPQIQRERSLAEAGVRKQILSLGWRRPLIILIPDGRFWQNRIGPVGAKSRVLKFLRGLADDGSITLIDATGFFGEDDSTRCDVFWDLYHVNAKGALELTTALLPEMQKNLYESPREEVRLAPKAVDNGSQQK